MAINYTSHPEPIAPEAEQESPGWLKILTSVSDLIERRRFWFLAAFCLAYLATNIRFAIRRPLWVDELDSLYVCTLPRLSDVWNALRQGIDQQPPLFEFLARHGVRTFGDALGMRLPAVLGFGVMVACIFIFVSRRLPAVYAFCAMLVPFGTYALIYPIEGRPYGLLAGFVGLTLVIWQQLGERKRPLTLLAFFLSCTLAVASHYLGFLSLAPIAAGEIARSIQRRKVNPEIWLCFLLSSAPLFFSLPFIRGAQVYTPGFWSKPEFLRSIYATYKYFLVPSPSLVIALLVAGLAVVLVCRRESVPARVPDSAVVDVIVAAAFALLPVLGVAFGMLSGGFVARYVLVTVMGFALGAAYLLWSLARRSAALGLIFLTVFGVYFLVAEFAVIPWLLNVYRPIDTAVPASAAGDNLPIVCSQPDKYMQTYYYAAPAVRERLYYIADRAIETKFAGGDTGSLLLLLLARIAPLHVYTYSDFTAKFQHFYVWGGEENWNIWVIPTLVESGAVVRIRKAEYAYISVYEVTMPPPSGAKSGALQ